MGHVHNPVSALPRLQIREKQAKFWHVGHPSRLEGPICSHCQESRPLQDGPGISLGGWLKL